MSEWIVRPARLSDLEQVHRLAGESPIGVTSLPDDRERLAQRLRLSETSFASDVAYPGEEEYFFVLERCQDGELIGCAGIQATCGYRQPFYSFRHETLVHASPELGINNKIHALSLCHDLADCSALNAFHVSDAWRDGSAAELISRARLLFIASHASRFSRRVIAEIVGYSDEAGRSPFWDGLGRHFFGLEYAEAERLDATQNRAFMAELLPHYPIYVSLLPDPAQDAIGAVHPKARRPYDILIDEGFETERYVDVYDAGPTLEAALDRIGSVTGSRRLQIEVSDVRQDGPEWLVVNEGLEAFRAGLVRSDIVDNGALRIGAADADALGIKTGDSVRAVPSKGAQA
ncbi:arginine N-succinyltransferase [Pseudomonas matsuisoli]|uniref:Arginine N-succinyltransferase n=1 Tax=Pseudomonas matsuisoli TaxID=1515666 RepID=A0A917PNG1_9PSED|nr:arginine N-succinyltransferase [Pseudomonas matsuisoli]GGJ85429.1 arginine N-succinyltransferase [Pseudomonas matsuisoli]